MNSMTVETIDLIAHPAHPPLQVRRVAARVIGLDDHWCVLRWRVEGTASLVVPAFAGAGRQDGLWQTTCFELFVRQDLEGGAYGEFNFSPSERWAAYDFTDYRAGMAERPMARGPVVTPRRGADVLICDVAIARHDLPPLPWRYGLTAVIEEAGEAKSYWAMAHGGDRPDFHDPACHAALLAPPVAP
jgi:hypothetical protein